MTVISLSKEAYEVLLWAKLKASEDDNQETLTHSGVLLWMKEKIKKQEEDKHAEKKT